MSKFKENLLLNVVFPIADVVMGTCAMKWYRQIEEMNTWSKEDIVKWQTHQLHLLINQAYYHTKYYREIMDERGLSPDSIKTLEDIKKLPILERETIINRFEDLKADNIEKIPHRLSSTGGSTGEPMKYICDENTWGFVTAMKIYSWQQTNYRYGDLFVSLGSSSLFPVNKKSPVHEIYFRLKNTIPLNGMNMDDDTCAKYMSIIQRKNVRYIYGYATAIYLLAQYCSTNNIDWHIEVAFPTAEKLLPQYREMIEKTWGARVVDCYGSKDGGITGYEINRGYYNVGYASWLEADYNEPSALYATNLIDFAFPTIRYFNRDEVKLGNPDEKYNYNGQVISEVIGRTSDVITLSNGHRLTNPGFTIMFRKFNVKAYRISQVSQDEILIQIQKLQNFTQEEHDLLCETMKKHVGDNVVINIEYVKGFNPLKNGKRSFFINSRD